MVTLSNEQLELLTKLAESLRQDKNFLQHFKENLKRLFFADEGEPTPDGGAGRPRDQHALTRAPFARPRLRMGWPAPRRMTSVTARQLPDALPKRS